MTLPAFVENLKNPAAYDHPIKYFRIIETHISWIILTGTYAYKIKKPVDFGFLNYSTLKKGIITCQEDIRLNSLLAPELYLGVVTINGKPADPHINGSGPILDYAVKMLEFSKIFLPPYLNNKNLLHQLIDQLAQLIAGFHLRTEVAPTDSIFGTPMHVHAPVIQNFEQISPFLTEKNDKQQLEYLQQWSEQQFQQHKHLLQERKNTGFIRDCHGDLHLKNIILYQQKPVLFDRIEFNDDLRWNDVMADIAFLLMDLEDQQQPAYAHRLLNTYLSLTGDYAGLAILPYYQAYRAIVRAKIALFTLHHGNLSQAEQQELWQKYRRLIQLAMHYANRKTPVLFITHGYSGSGKSTIANSLVEQLGFIQLRSDIERKRLCDLPADAKTHSALNKGIYDPAITQQTYQQLLNLANIVIAAGYSVIVDAAFLKNSQRGLFYNLAKKLNIPFTILSCQAAREKLMARINSRQAQARDPSEARIDVLGLQESEFEALTLSEQKHTIVIDTLTITPEKLREQIQCQV